MTQENSTLILLEVWAEPKTMKVSVCYKYKVIKIEQMDLDQFTETF